MTAAETEVERYTDVYHEGPPGTAMSAVKDGLYVLATDYDRLRAECEALRVKVGNLERTGRSVYDLCEGDYLAHCVRGEALEALRIALDAARSKP